VAEVALDWTGALPDSIRGFRIERTASWHQRLPVEWELVGKSVTALTFTDSVRLDPAAWPWTLGTGMGRIITYRITPEPPRAVDWTAPRLVSALVLAPGFHGLDEVYARLREAESAHPEVVTLEQLGESAWGGRPILAVRLTAPGEASADGAEPPSKPAVLVVGGIHTREPFGIEIGVDLVEEWSAAYGDSEELTRLLDAAELWVVPVMNPGGWGHLSEGFPGYMRKSLADVNGDGVPTPSPLYPLQWPGEPLLEPAFESIYCEGVDLNRNFAPHWELSTGPESESTEPGGQKYRGSEPFSEPETEAIRRLALRERFVFSLFYHEAGDRLYFLRDTPDDDLFQEIGNRLGRAGRKRPGDWGGCSLAFMYLEVGTIDFTVEGARDARGDAEWLLAPRAAARDSVSAHHRGIVRELVRLAGGSGLHGRVVDGETGRPVAAEFEIRRRGEESVRRLVTDARGSFHRYLLPGEYTLRAEIEEAGSGLSRDFDIAPDQTTWLELVIGGS
jgi:hypothetical protein